MKIVHEYILAIEGRFLFGTQLITKCFETADGTYILENIANNDYHEKTLMVISEKVFLKHRSFTISYLNEEKKIMD